MPFVRRGREAHRSVRERRKRRSAMMRVIEQLIETIEALFYPDRRPPRL